VVSSTPRPHFTPGKDPVPILKEAGWDPGPVCTGRKFRPLPGFDPGPSIPQSVAIPTELPGLHVMPDFNENLNFRKTLKLQIYEYPSSGVREDGQTDRQT